MSDDNQVSILYNNGSTLVAKADLQVSFSVVNNRRQLPEAFELAIDTVWTGRCADNPTIWNGSKFRLHSVHIDTNRRYCWNLGLTTYKDFLGTNFSPDAEELEKLGREKFDNSQAFMSDPLGVGALLLTSDKQVVLLKRSSTCAEAPGLYDIPGGHPEPEEIAGNKDVKDMDLSLFTADVIRNEIFTSILREIRDEVNLPMNTLSEPLLLGIALNKCSHGRPSSEYLVRTSLHSEQVIELYNKGSQAEAEETTNIKLLSHDEVLTIKGSNLWDCLAPSARGCFLLYLNYVHQSTTLD